MSTLRNIYVGPLAVGFLLHHSAGPFEAELQGRLACPLRDDATHHWIPTSPGKSPTLLALDRYADGTPGSFAIHTSSEEEIRLFIEDYRHEIEVLKSHYEKVEVIFGAVSY